MISISLVTITSGSSTVALVVAKSMIRSPNAWRASASARVCHRIADLRPQLVKGLHVADALDELVGDLGQQLLPQVEQLDLEVRLLALQLLDPVVVGEGDVESLRLADLHPDEVVLPARDHAVLADDERHAIRRATVEWLAVDRAGELHAGDVASLRGTVVDRPQRGLLLAQVGDDLLDLLIGDARESRARTGSRCRPRARRQDERAPWR